MSKYFRRRTIIIPGYFILGVLNFLIAIGMATEEAAVTYVMISGYTIAYQLLNGSIVWLYLVETCSDASLSLTALTQWLVLTFISLVTPASLKGMHSGVFFIYSIVTFVGAFGCYRWVRETEGFTDKEKKELFETLSAEEQNRRSNR